MHADGRFFWGQRPLLGQLTEDTPFESHDRQILLF